MRIGRFAASLDRASVRSAARVRSPPVVARRTDHGWWPYLAPMFSFLALLELARRAPSALTAFFALATVLVPFGLLLHHARRTGYPELRGYAATPGKVALDAAVGVLGALIWMLPYLWLPSLRPDPSAAFDPAYLGASNTGFALGLRCFGFALVTPFVEELFVRGWLARYADVFDKPDDFRDVPIGRYTLRSFLTVVIFFTASHMRWEWPVAIAWIVLTQLWLYRRKHLLALVIVHAASNLSIFLFVLLASGRIPDADGSPLSLWFFL
jgi:CAAX prenyl protease-like protein